MKLIIFSSSTEKRSELSKQNLKDTHSLASRSNQASTAKACSTFIRSGGSHCPSLTNRQASKRNSPTSSIPLRNAATSSPSTSQKHRLSHTNLPHQPTNT